MSTKKRDLDLYLSAVAAAAAKKRNGPTTSEVRVGVGDVGHTFRKEFDIGWFRGIVVAIRPGAAGGRDRRCYYEDGDSEDLSLSELRNLALLDQEVITMTVRKPDDPVAAASAEVFDIVDDEVESESGHDQYKSGVKVKCMRERGGTNTGRIGNNKKKDSGGNNNSDRQVQEPAQVSQRPNSFPLLSECPVSDSNQFKVGDTVPSAAKDANGSETNLNDGTLDGASENGLRKRLRVDEANKYENTKPHRKQKKRALENTSPGKQILSLDYDIPVDEATVSTLLLSSPSVHKHSNKDDGADDSDDGGEEWLAKKAASLGARQKRRASSTRQSCITSSSSSSDGHACAPAPSHRNNAYVQSNDAKKHSFPPLSSYTFSIDKPSGGNNNSDRQVQEPAQVSQRPNSFPLLSECPVSDWCGCLVYHRNDLLRRVGKVIFKEDRSMVLVDMDKIVRYYHERHLIVVPSNQFEVGETVPCNFVVSSPGAGGKKSSELCGDQLTFWICEKCSAGNHGHHSTCQSCNSTKTDSSDQSISLGVGEAVSMNDCQQIHHLEQNIEPSWSKIHGSSTFREDIGIYELSWDINSIEESVLCENRAAFSVGVRFRKFFKGYGFYDGRILSWARKPYSGSHVLVYRCKYDDDDEEDILHHEIASLCQLYEQNVSPAAPPRDQIPPGSVFETYNGNTIKIICHKTPPESRKGRGETVVVQFQGLIKENEYALVDLQFAILRKVAVSLSGPHSVAERTVVVSQAEPRKRCNAACDGDDDGVAKVPTTSSKIIHPHDNRSGCDVGMRDHAGCSDDLSWNSIDSEVCQICSIDKDDDQVVICDNCHNGFHMYCVKPVMVIIPKGDWFCSTCASRSKSRLSFDEFSASITDQEMFRFLGLPYKTADEFFTTHSNAIFLSSLNSLATVKDYAKSKGIPAKHPVIGLQNINFNQNVDEYDWRLPMPLTDEKIYRLSLSSIVAAMKSCEMQSYLNDLTYGGSAEESMNDPSMETSAIKPMRGRNLDVFRAFQHNLKEGVFPPIQIVRDENFGLSVKALTQMKQHTLIAQYLGEVITMEDSESQSSSDSLMILLDSGNPLTSLIIDPSREGNFARFLGGINNGNEESKRRMNVRSLRFVMDGKLRVCLFTSRCVKAGELLHYDYNAGHKGKDIREWTKTGFYDTSNFD